MLRICDQSDHTQPGKPRLLPPEDDKRHSASMGRAKQSPQVWNSQVSFPNFGVQMTWELLSQRAAAWCVTCGTS